ncbi:hypothetical protein [Bacillus marasmi]|uniref:hypothetical protein n=1 Tax=Bacillus marasmi TaxID=1926279 RepID=UPI0011C8ADA5|nr:hypothetical protein [Bacillus marasmi]
MREQEFIDVKMNESDSLANILEELVNKRRKETGSYNIFVQDVIPVGQNRFTIILRTVVESF